MIAYIIYMWAIIVIILESVAVFFIAIFARGTDTSIVTQTNGSTNKTLVLNSLTLMFAFTLMYSPFRKLSIFTLISLLIIVSISVQTNILFGTFWNSCFNGFSQSFQMTALVIIRSVFASFAALLTVLDVTGLFDYWQVYLIIPPIMTVGYSLSSAIVTYGLKTFDGGGGYCIFLYSGVCSLMIWAICIRGKVEKNRYKIKQSYVNQTLSLIGVIIAFIVWPKFNMAGALVSSVQSTATSTSLQNSALPNTYLGLSAAIVLSILFASKQTKQQRLKYKVYVDGFVNGGIVIASYQDIVLNPTACLLVSSITTIITIIIHKYFLTESDTEAEGTFKQLMKNYSKIVYRIAFSFIGSVVASIVVATRDGLTPALLSSNYSKIAGFELVAWIVVASIAALFGFIAAFCINVFVNIKKNQFSPLEEQAFKIAADDVNFFEGVVNEEMYPLYYDIFDQVEDKQKQKINMAQYTTNAIKKSLLVAANDSPLKQMSIVKNQNRPDNLYDMTRIIHKKDLGSNSNSNRKSKKEPQDMQVFQNKMAQMSDDEQDKQHSPVKRLSRKQDSLGKQSVQDKSGKDRKPEVSQSQAIKQQSVVRSEVRR